MFVLFLNFVAYGLIVKTETGFSFFLHKHPILLIFQIGAPCLLGWVGLSIGTDLASFICLTATLDRRRVTDIGLQKPNINAYLHYLHLTFISVV